MQAELASRGAEHALFDPSIARADDVEAAARAGDLLAMYTASAGELAYRVVVDEELPEALRARISTTTKDVLLRVPSGTLVASELGAAAGATLAIPAGNYLVDVHELDYDWKRDIAPVLAAELPAYQRERRLVPVAGALSLAGIGGVVGGAFAWQPLVIAIAAVVLLAGAGLARAVRGERYLASKQAIAQRFPGLVLVLRRLDDGAELAGHAGRQLSFKD